MKTQNTKKIVLTKKHAYTRKNKDVFRKEDFKSGDGMLTTVWGPSLWHTLHTISFNYPLKPTKRDKINYKRFIYQLRHVLPCKHCRINLKENFKCLPLLDKHMKNRYTYSKYIYDLHELINKMLHKTSNLSYKDVRERYEHFRARCNKGKIVNVQKLKKNITQKKKSKKEMGCIDPLYGNKSKCIIKIVPQKTKCDTFQMNNNCKSFRVSLDE